MVIRENNIYFIKSIIIKKVVSGNLRNNIYFITKYHY